MNRIYKTFLALSLIVSLGLSAMEGTTEKSVKIKTTREKAILYSGTVIANAVAVAALTYANAQGVEFMLNKSLFGGGLKSSLYMKAFASMLANIAGAQLSSELIKKMGFESNPLLLHAASTSWFSIMLLSEALS